MNIPDRLKRKPRYPRELHVWSQVFPKGQPTGLRFLDVPRSANRLPRHSSTALSLLWGRFLNRLRRFRARLTGTKGQWLVISRVGVPFGLPCALWPRCEFPGIWDVKTGWLCKRHRALGPRIITEIQKAYPAVGVNGPSLWMRLPQERDNRKGAWLDLLRRQGRWGQFGMVELPGWIG